jgi:hypothetical protein
MTLIKRKGRNFGLGGKQTPDATKSYEQGKFSESADTAAKKFLEHKKSEPGVKAESELTPLQKRMQSGSF